MIYFSLPIEVVEGLKALRLPIADRRLAKLNFGYPFLRDRPISKRLGS